MENFANTCFKGFRDVLPFITSAVTITVIIVRRIKPGVVCSFAG